MIQKQKLLPNELHAEYIIVGEKTFQHSCFEQDISHLA
jgi:hypothetical protein